MTGLIGVRAKHRSDGSGGHGDLPFERACPPTLTAELGSKPRKVPRQDPSASFSLCNSPAVAIVRPSNGACDAAYDRLPV
jgi:hypothetical protein